MPKQKKISYKFLTEGHSACTCCKIEYLKGSILTGFTIALIPKDNEENGYAIDIPAREIPNLIKVAKKILKEEL